MDKKIKIFAGVMASLGIICLVFILIVKKSTVTTPSSSILNTHPTIPKKTVSKTADSTQNQTAFDEWQKCKDKAIESGKNLNWKVYITESIPAGGTYAKAYVENNVAYPVHIVIKDGAQNAEQIKQRLEVGKTGVFRLICTDLASDGSVVAQTF